MWQKINPQRTVFRSGDVVVFEMSGMVDVPGGAYVRTTLGSGDIVRSEAVAAIEKKRAAQGLAWHDVPMRRDDDGIYRLDMPLTEVGVFDAKCFFAPADGSRMRWASGDNFRIKVECAANVCANNIYCAFVRQFRAAVVPHVLSPEKAAGLDEAGYTLIPPSGTFRNLIGRLDHIFSDLGCHILQLLPIHPAPSVYARMGRFGSPFAALDYFAVDPALAEFDRKSTPLEQFVELLDAVHARHGRLFLDIPVNHTGWGSRLQNEHPDYFVRRQDKSFESPGAWGVVWEDLCKLNYHDERINMLMAEVFLYWCRHGVDGFRCDAGYMLPAKAWNYIIPKVRSEYPDTVFMLEGLGGKISVQENLLLKSDLDWAYSELFQNYSRDQINDYFPYVAACANRFGTLVNFAETHDNARLAAESPEYAEMRCVLSAMLSCGGSFGITNGMEFFAAEKIDVHGASALNWGAENNCIALLRQLATLLESHPAFFAGSTVRLIQQGGGNFIAALREGEGGEKVLALVNLDMQRPVAAHWTADEFFVDQAFDLLRGGSVKLARHENLAATELPPGGALCLSATVCPAGKNYGGETAVAVRQRAAALAFTLWRHFRPEETALPDFDAAEELLRSPLDFICRITRTQYPGVVTFDAAYDCNRMVMLCRGDVLLIRSENHFRSEIVAAGNVRSVAVSLPLASGEGHFAVMRVPEQHEHKMRNLEIKLAIYAPRAVRKIGGTLLQLASERTHGRAGDVTGCVHRAHCCHGAECQLPPEAELPAAKCRHFVAGRAGNSFFRMKYSGAEVTARRLYAFGSNNRGGMCMIPADWGRIYSKYDAILAGNGDAPYPVDRRTMFTRLRAWLVVDDFSQELTSDLLESFTGTPDNMARWIFRIPSGQGKMCELELILSMAYDADALKLTFRRIAVPDDEERAGCAAEARLILRPDLENRINHHVTKAFAGPEKDFPAAVAYDTSVMSFAPGGDRLTLSFPGGRYVHEPEWHYMADLPFEEHYGQEHATDLFSPGYFEFKFAGCAGECTLLAAINGKDDLQSCRWPAAGAGSFAAELPPYEALVGAMRHFVVKRDQYSTVIAGYPWFLDWGRDTLIALRGLLCSDFRAEARDILRQFAMFEERGTIPNIIHGDTVGNRDTSDAPLWLIVAAFDYAERYGDETLWSMDCGGGRKFRDVLYSIADHYLSGTPNGIYVDKASGLVFSPAHYTWMDTNYPAGTPREGYPVEIQALWYAALSCLGKSVERYAVWAAKVKESLLRLFYDAENGIFADCLHGASGTAAHDAVADDHNRCNQLLAITLGALTDKAACCAVMRRAELLLVPGAIRSMAPGEVKYRLPIIRDGRLLNDPAAPYIGAYRGPEDTSRKVSYHNGTAWEWMFPSYCEALAMLGGDLGRRRARELLSSVSYMADCGVPGELAEVADGDAPHMPGGCAAQAWSVTEACRVMSLLGADGEKDK